MILSIQWKLALKIIKGVSGVAGGALVLTEDHPYIALGVLLIGAAANEAITFLKVDEV